VLLWPRPEVGILDVVALGGCRAKGSVQTRRLGRIKVAVDANGSDRFSIPRKKRNSDAGLSWLGMPLPVRAGRN